MQLHAEKLSKFVMSSSLDLMGDENDVQELSIHFVYLPCMVLRVSVFAGGARTPLQDPRVAAHLALVAKDSLQLAPLRLRTQCMLRRGASQEPTVCQARATHTNKKYIYIHRIHYVDVYAI